MPSNVTDNPDAAATFDPTQVEYIGFWARVLAALIDTALLMLFLFPLILWFYGWEYFDVTVTGTDRGLLDFFLNWIAPAVAVVVFWLTKRATPGKMVISAIVVDAQTGKTLSVGQSIGRYLAYFVSVFPFCLGLIWVAFDKRKQGFHDKLAGTIVIRKKRED